MNIPLDLPDSATAFAQVGVSRPHESAHLHVAGTAPYTDDLPELAGTLHAALGLSPLAHGVIDLLDLYLLRRAAQRLGQQFAPGIGEMQMVVAAVGGGDRKSVV